MLVAPAGATPTDPKKGYKGTFNPDKCSYAFAGVAVLFTKSKFHFTSFAFLHSRFASGLGSILGMNALSVVA